MFDHKKILLIDPDALLAKTYSEVLKHNGASVIWTASASQAINTIEENLPDLIITELQLVSHSGIELLYELRSYPEWQNIPLIVLSVVPPFEFADKRLVLAELKIDHYLYKPVTSLRELVSAATELLNRTVNETV